MAAVASENKKKEQQEEVSLHVELLGRKFSSPFCNASGVMCSTADQLNAVLSSAAGSACTKSCTMEKRHGNPEPRYAAIEHGTINSMGLPNEGCEYYCNFAQERLNKKKLKTSSIAGTSRSSCSGQDADDKPLFISIAGLTFDEMINMAKMTAPLCAVSDDGGDGDASKLQQVTPMLCVNLSCPNVVGKAQVGYDFAALDAYLAAISAVHNNTATSFFGVKLPPYFDVSHFDQVAAILNKYDKVKFVTMINSVGNALAIDVDTETVVIKPKDGFGGLGGTYVLPTALANVNAFYRRCPNKLIIGCGGVSTGEHAFMHILAGASLVEIGSALAEGGVEVFQRISDELAALMKRKGYASVSEFRGKLKTIA